MSKKGNQFDNNVADNKTEEQILQQWHAAE